MFLALGHDVYIHATSEFYLHSKLEKLYLQQDDVSQMKLWYNLHQRPISNLVISEAQGFILQQMLIIARGQ